PQHAPSSPIWNSEPTRCGTARPSGAHCHRWGEGVNRALIAFVCEDVRVVTTPSRAARPIFSDDDSELHASAAVACLASPTQLEHAVAQGVSHDRRGRWWRRSNRDRSRRGHGAILRCGHDPGAVATLLIATILVVAIAAGPRLALRGDESASPGADERANRSPLTTTRYATDNRPGGSTEQGAAQGIWILCRRALNRCNKHDCE